MVLTGLPARIGWSFLLLLAAVGAGGEERPRLEIPTTLPAQFLLRRGQPIYQNFAFHSYTNYPNHSFPYEDSPRAFYGSVGDYLITGYDLFQWVERREPGLNEGSLVFKDLTVWESLVDYLVVARDTYGSSGYSAIVGDGLIARFTPLTLSKTDLNGARLDLSTPHLAFTILGSRIDAPNDASSIFDFDDAFTADVATVLLGGRLQARLGALQVGLNSVNLHLYQSSQPGNSLKGRLRPQLPLVEYVLIRVSDDSPTDGSSGAVVQEMRLIVNGEQRPDLVPSVIRHRAGASPQVGTVSRVTGEYRQILYNQFTGDLYRNPLYYRGRGEIPLFADYIYRIAHEAGADVSSRTNLKGLLSVFAVESPGVILRADGDEMLIYMFDLSREAQVESVEVEALLANDYRVELSTLATKDRRSQNPEVQFRGEFYRTVLRAKGNVQDMANLKWVRFGVGENTAIFTSSADLQLSLVGLEINAELARSALYSRYPAHVERIPAFDQAPRFADRGSAYFINVSRDLGPGQVGMEYFSTKPEFTTEMRVYHQEQGRHLSRIFAGQGNNTIYWDLVQDNEDGDRYPDINLGSVIGARFGPTDVDGVFPARDEDNDGILDTNRNFNEIPDYEEPFLQYEVEPREYEYGLDHNNNDEPDVREDDLDPDYPYEQDQRGYHLFGQMHITPHWAAGLGRYASAEIAGAGRNRTSYGFLTYRREGTGRFQRLFFENRFRRVQDDIPDEFAVLMERARSLEGVYWFYAAPYDPVFVSQFREDLRFYQDSYVNDAFLEAQLRPSDRLHFVQKLRLRLNWQQGGELYNGLFQRRRRLDYWTFVSRADYTWQWGKLSLIPQFKFMLLRQLDKEAGRALRDEVSVIPILRLKYPLLRRTTLQAGLQGLGPLPYRFENRTRDSESFERRTAFVTLTNRSSYFGYDLRTIVGFSRDRRDFDDPFQLAREFNRWSFFVRTLIGFTEFGQPF